MSYEIRYSDLVSVRTQIVNYVSQIETQLAEVKKSYDTLLQSGCITGEAANTLKIYVFNVHENILSVVYSMLTEYLNKIMVYENGLHKLEGNRDAIIYEEELKLLSEALGRAKKKYVGITGDVTSALSSVSDIYYHSEPDINAVETGYDKTARIASDFQTAVGQYEHAHRNDCKQVNEYISKINQILSSQLNNQNATISIDSIKQVVYSQTFQDLNKMQETTSQFAEDNKVALGKEYKLMKTEADEEAARQRELDGILKIGTGALALIAVVATGGTAAPLVVAFQIGAVSYGVAEGMEGVQDVYYGANGDTESFAVNPLRDQIMAPALAPVIGQENVQTAYEIFGLASTIGCGGASQLAKQGIKATAKNFGEAYAKEGIKQIASMGAGYGAGQVADHFGVDDGGRQFISLAAGLSVNYGLGHVNALQVGPPKTSVQQLTSKDIQRLLKKHYFTPDQFSELLHYDTELSEGEKILVNQVRDEIGLPKAGEKMAKFIPESDISKYLKGDYDSVGGFVSRAEYSKKLNGFDAVYEGNRLDYDGTAFHATDNTYGKIKFKHTLHTTVEIPRYEATPENFPYSGKGFTASEKVILPEFTQARQAFANGDIIEIHASNTGKVIEKYIFNNGTWIKK